MFFRSRNSRHRPQRTADGVGLPSKLEPIVWTIPGKETKNGLAHEVR